MIEPFPVFQVPHSAFRGPSCQRINLHGKKRLAAERISSPLRVGANILPFAKMLTWRRSRDIFLPMVEWRSLLE
jgi:hypothetical protein